MQPLDFLLVRKAQVFSEIKALGFLYTVIVTALASVLFIFFYKTQASIQGVVYAGVALTFFLATIHVSRSDHRFITLTTKNPLIIYFAEYGTALLPFLVLSWISFGIPLLVLMVMPVLLISLWKVPEGRAIQSNFTHLLIPETNFEWKAGTRKTGFILVALWICSIAVTWLPYAPVAVLWFILLVNSSFYDEGESREMLESYQLSAVSFLKNKILKQVLVFVILVSPVVVTALLFFPDRWWVLIFFLLFSSLNIAVFVVSKYSVWRPGEINRSQGIVNVLCLLGLFLPFLLPLPLFILIRNYRKAIRNLKPYLDDFNN